MASGVQDPDLLKCDGGRYARGFTLDRVTCRDVRRVLRADGMLDEVPAAARAAEPDRVVERRVAELERRLEARKPAKWTEGLHNF
jgi:hypothetical protein